MKYFSKYLGYLILLIVATLFCSCFKSDFPKVEPPKVPEGETAPNSPLSEHKKILIIGVDGCRGDALKGATIPNIDALLSHAVYSFDATTQPPFSKGAGWSSLLTGVWSDRHHVTNNDFSHNNFTNYHPIFKYIKRIYPELKIASICSRAKINDYLMSDADIRISTNRNDEATKDSAVFYLKNDDLDIMLLEFDGVNQAGVQFGYDTTVPAYMQAISKIDEYVGEVFKALQGRPAIEKEDWLIVLTSDHGGDLNGVDGNDRSDKSIFTIFYNKTFKSEELLPPEDVFKSLYLHTAHDAGYVLSDDPNYLNFNIIPKFTLQVAMMSPNPMTGSAPILTNKDWNSGSNPGWVISVEGRSWKFNAGGNYKRFDMNSNSPPLGDGRWHYLAVTVDKTGYCRLYQDDSLVNYMNINGLIDNTWSPTSGNKLATGDDLSGHNKTSWGISKFHVANIRIWDTILSLDDMRKYAPGCDTAAISTDNPFYNNLVGWWKGTEGKGGSLKNYSPTGGENMQVIADTTWDQVGLDLCNNPLPPPVPTTVDIAPAILAWLNIQEDPGWELNGFNWLSN